MKAIVYSTAAGFALAAPTADVVAKFDEFRAKWGRNYLGEEYSKRVRFFEEQMHQVDVLQHQELGTATYTYLGPFADQSPAEMSQRFGLLPQENFERIPLAPLLNKTLGDSFDWVSKGAVNPVKDQGQCGSCWSFSTVCNLEGTGFVTTGKLVSLSEQNIMDCDKSCYSCNGGLPSLALTWSSKNGVASEASYPYKAHDESCKSVGALAHNTGYNKISHNEDQIAQALVHYGPLSIGVDATPFQTYHGGVMNNPSCSKTRLDHAVNIVGYGVDQIQYWKIRNSWSANWGEAGYIRVSRGHDTCGLANTVVTATGVSISDHPGPAPPPAPPGPSPGCSDQISNCPHGGWECEFLAPECQKSCGCCGSNPPKYCSGLVSATSQSLWDEIKKLVCEALESGVPTHEIDKVVCAKVSAIEVICDNVVGIIVKEIESGALKCSSEMVV